MINYKKCTEVELEKVYMGFKKGFSDYIIKFEMSQEDFVKRFLGPEGNNLENSFVALDEEEAVGLILGGMKNYEGVKTMRCGTLCIDPEYRGKGISQELFRLHKDMALEHGCKQLFLEVIVGNDRAIKFYNNLGYSKIYDLSYFTLADTAAIREINGDFSDIKMIDYETISSIADKIEDVHINWQNDFDYIQKLDGITYYGAYMDSELIGAMGVSASGKIYMLWVMPQYRHRRIAVSLLNKSIKEHRLEKLYISFPNHSKLEGFVQHLGFTKDKISQYEMYLTL